MRKTSCLAAFGIAGFLASGCSLGSPISVANRPLAEQLEERNAQVQVEETPEAIAFTDTWESGTFLRLDVASGEQPILRSGPGPSFEEAARIESGAEVLATGNQTGEWIHVLYSAFEGWIHTDQIDIAIERTAPPIEESRRDTITYIIASEFGGLNVRSGPGTQHDLLLGTSNGDEVRGTGNIENGWVEVIVEGTTGWVAGRHVQLLDGTSPVSAPAATAAPRRRAPAPAPAPATAPPTSEGAEGEGADGDGPAGDGDAAEEDAPRQRGGDEETEAPAGNGAAEEAPAASDAPEPTEAPPATQAPAATEAPAPAATEAPAPSEAAPAPAEPPAAAE